MLGLGKFILYLTIVLVIISSITAAPTSTNDETSNSGGKAESPSPKCAAAAAASASACFSRDTLVTLVNGQQIPIEELRSGHQLLTIDGNKIVNTEMMMMLDQNQLSSAMFFTIVTASGHKVSLTGLHLIGSVTYNDEVEYKPAKNIKLGDLFLVISNGQVYSSPVINITMEMKTGYYAPFTTTGTVLVNGIAASCFANVKNHNMVQFYTSPLRWYYRLSRLLSIEKPFGSDSFYGIHYIPKILFEIVQSIYPSILHLT